jgi:two-component system response regulator CpxR
MKLLVVDDDPALCELFEESGYLVEFEPDADGGLRRAQTEPYDLLILDIVLSGFEVLRRLRDQSRIPVLILSAKAERLDRVNGLRAGADDYLAKPFFPDELLARIEAILRRTGTASPRPDALEVGELRLLPASRDVYFQSKRLDLTAMEVEILECLMDSVGKVVSRDRLSLRLYNRLSAPFERNIDTHVSRIRRKMGEGRGMILSVRGTGYQIRDAANVTLLHNCDASN